MPHDGHHDHDHDHGEGSPLPEIALRVKALESILVEKGYVDPAAIDAIVETYETKVGPRNGAQVVARAWSDPAYLAPAAQGCHAPRSPSSAITGRQGEHMVVVENTPDAAQPRRLHLVLLLSLAGARPAAGLVQGGALSLARGDRSPRRPGGVRRRRCRQTRGSASGIPRRRSAISCCRCARRAPRA